MTALIDADSLVYVIGWTFKDQADNTDLSAVREVQKHCDTIVSQMLTLVRADSYIGAFSSPKNFRHRIYKYAPYKGNRPEKPDWYRCWEDVIKDYLLLHWNFGIPDDLEADDIVAALQWIEHCTNSEQTVICSPDKDLRQVPGLHYNPSKEGAVVESITPEEADYNFWLQMLTGDETDCVAGVPGLGPVKAKKILDVDNTFLYQTVVRTEYRRYFGAYYGAEIFQQTKDTLELMNPLHTYWESSKEQIIRMHVLCKRPFEDTVPSPFS